MDSSPVESYLLQLDQQLAAALQDLTAVDDLSLWARPAPQEWSPGEHLSHVAAVHHFFRRVNQLLWPISSRMARRRLHHPYQAIIDDVYARPAFPHAIGRTLLASQTLLPSPGFPAASHGGDSRGAPASAGLLSDEGRADPRSCPSLLPFDRLDQLHAVLADRPLPRRPSLCRPSGRRSPRAGAGIRTSPDITLACGS